MQDGDEDSIQKDQVQLCIWDPTEEGWDKSPTLLYLKRRLHKFSLETLNQRALNWRNAGHT